MHEVLVNRLGGLSLPRKSVVRLTDRPDMTLDVYRGRKTTTQFKNNTIGVTEFAKPPTRHLIPSNESYYRVLILAYSFLRLFKIV